VREFERAGFTDVALVQIGDQGQEEFLQVAEKELLPALVDLMRWGDAHLAPDGPPAVLRHGGCGGELGRGAVCDRCGAPAQADEVEWYRGPGTHKTPGERMIPA